MTERAPASKVIPVALTTVCAVASLVCVFKVGGGQKSVVLLVMFTFWVAAPFAAFVSAHLSLRHRALLKSTAAALAVASTAIYAGIAFGAPRAQPAKFFLLVPAVNWLIFGAAWLLERSVKNRE
jgi:hypothetical protein